MKRTVLVFAVVVFSLVMILPFSFIHVAQAQGDYAIQQADHVIEVLRSGHVLIKDTVKISGSLPASFEIGFPFKYNAYLLKAVAYDNNSLALPVTLNVQLQSGYYGVSVSFPDGASQTFTVVFVFSNTLITSISTGLQLDFPAYPSLTKAAAQCNVTLNFPAEVISPKISKDDGALNGTSYGKQNLEALTYAPAKMTFSIDSGYLQQVDIPTLNRKVSINPAGAISVTDSYKLINTSPSNIITSFMIDLPPNAENVVVRDGFSRTLTTAIDRTSVRLIANLSLIVTMNPSDSSLITLEYSLPSISPQSGRFVLNLDLYPVCDYYIDLVTVTIAPPEGANIVAPQLSSIGKNMNLDRNVFQETLSVTKEGITYIDSKIPSEDTLQVSFDYSSLWVALLPTSWMWAIAIVGCVIVAIWMRPKAKVAPMIVAPKMTAGLGPEQIRVFTESYEERSKITAEINSLEARVQRGRMPRRRYKVQRKTLELRLHTLNTNITKLKDMLRNAGGSYADVVRQLEFAEEELNAVEQEIISNEARHATGELPIEGYRKQLAELERRKTKAETTINGLLLRLRGEIR